MGEARRWLCRGILLLLLAAGCGHTSTTTRGGAPECEEDTGVRTRCGDSATLRIQLLITRGELAEAEALLVQALAAGLVTQAAAERLRERAAERRPLPPIVSEESDPGEPSTQQRTCWTELPGYPVCQQLPSEYTFHSARQAFEAMKQRLDEKALTLHKPEATRGGPCPGLGQHINVRMNGSRAGSITCCPCCVETTQGPLQWTKCRIVW